MILRCQFSVAIINYLRRLFDTLYIYNISLWNVPSSTIRHRSRIRQTSVGSSLLSVSSVHLNI